MIADKTIIDRMSSRPGAWLRLTAALGLVCLSACGEDEECSQPTEGLGQPTEWERAYLDGPAPVSPSPAFVQGEENVPLAHRTWLPSQAPGAAVVFVHGSSAHSREYAGLGQGLSQSGVVGRLIDVRGHGLSICRPDGDCSNPATIDRTAIDDGRYYPGRLGDARDANQLIRDLTTHLEDVRATWPDLPICLAGHSSGAGLVARFVEHGGLAAVDRVALVAPHNHADQPQNHTVETCGDTIDNGYAVVGLGAIGDALRGNEHRYTLTFRKEAQYLDPLDTLANSYTVMVGMQTAGPESFLVAFQRPTLWIAATQDALFDLDIQRQQFEALPGGGSFVVFDDTSHIGLAWSAEVGELIGQWCQTQTAP